MDKVNKIDNSTFGGRLRSQREKLGLNLTKAAQLLQVSPSNLSSYEKNASVPSATTLLRISKAYNSTIMWFLAGEEDSNVAPSLNAQIGNVSTTNPKTDPLRYMIQWLRVIADESPERQSWALCQFEDAFGDRIRKLKKKYEAEQKNSESND